MEGVDVGNLKVLDLSFNGLETMDGDVLGESTGTTANAPHAVLGDLVSLQDLRMNDNKLKTLASPTFVVLWDKLVELRVQNNLIDSLAGVEKFRKLTSLRLDGNPLGNALLRSQPFLEALPLRLTRLNISRCGLTCLSSLASSAAAKRIEELRCDGNVLNPKALDALKNCAKLVELHLADCGLTQTHLPYLRAVAPTLHTLVLDGNPGLCRKESGNTSSGTKKNPGHEEPSLPQKTLALDALPRLPKLVVFVPLLLLTS